MNPSPLPMPPTNAHNDIRAPLRALCKKFPSVYFRKIDEQRGYPEEFVKLSPTPAGSPP